MNLLKQLWSWVMSFFKNPPSIEKKEQPKIKRTRKIVQRHATLKDLLEDIEFAFNEIKIDYHRMSAVKKRDIEGLKRYGISVIPGFDAYREECISAIGEPIVRDTSKLSAIIFMATNYYKYSGYKDPDGVLPDFFYAIKMKKPPWFVARKIGVYYECAFGYIIDGKQYWAKFFVSIDLKTGKIFPTHYLTQQMVRVPKSDPYFQKKWQLSSWDIARNDVTEKNISAIISLYINEWNERAKMWSTTIEKDGIRANFYVDSKDTKYYFKDRQKTFTENGQTKKIIHIVDDHERIVNGKKTIVRAHVRGENKFMWSGYKCRVISPTYHQFDYRDFNAASSQDPIEIKSDHVSLTKVANTLHNIEDMIVNKIKNPISEIRRHR